MSGVTVRVLADPERGEPAGLFHDVVAYLLVDAEGMLYARMVDAAAAPWLAEALHRIGRDVEAYVATGTWPSRP